MVEPDPRLPEQWIVRPLACWHYVPLIGPVFLASSSRCRAASARGGRPWPGCWGWWWCRDGADGVAHRPAFCCSVADGSPPRPFMPTPLARRGRASQPACG